MCDASKCFLSSNFLSNNDFRPGSVFDDACVALFLIQFFGTMLVTPVNNICATMTQGMTKNSQEPGKQSHHGGKSRHFNGKSDFECMYSM